MQGKSMKLDTVFIIMILLYSGVRSQKCHFDQRCICRIIHDTMYLADCSDRKFTDIPQFSEDIEEIDLSHNEIVNITEGIFRNHKQLKILDLSYNYLQQLERTSLQGLDNLTSLIINNNDISAVDEYTFSFVKKLEEINFQSNPFDSLKLNFKETTLLVSAKLDFQPNKTEENKSFWGMPNLRYLDVSGMSGNCKVHTMTKQTFELLPKLENITMSKCFINYIYIGTFRALLNLTFLDLSYNKCLKFSGFENITYDLPYTSIKVLKINKIHQTFEVNTVVTVENMKNLQNTSLQELHVESNRIQIFERNVLQNLPPSLRSVYLGDNQFSYGEYLKHTDTLPFQFANLSSLFSSHDPREKPEPCVKISQCHWSCSISASHCRSSCSRDRSQKEYVENYLLDSIKNTTFVFPVPENLTEFIYTNCNLRYEIPTVITSANKVRHIDMSSNIFYSWIGPVVSFNDLEHLDLSSNFCSNISNHFFLRVQNLKQLYIQNNLLGFVLPTDVGGQILQHVGKLQDINLSENKIISLPENFFKNQQNLNKLNLSNNLLENISFKLSHMTNLSVVDLSNNRLSFLDVEVRKQLNSIFKHNANVKLNISGNPFLCNCDTIDFVEWISTNYKRFGNLYGTHCQRRNKSDISLKYAVGIYNTLQKNCTNYTTLIIAVVALILLFVSILTTGLIYRHRWKIYYLFYIVKSKHQGKIKTPSSTDDRMYEYDAFISYADQDSAFVYKMLLEELEDRGGLKVCIHKRDFLPGNDIASNITSAIHLSRKVVIIMTRNFLGSYWCMFEYNMARMESIYSRDKENILFLVFLEQIRPSQIPLHILEVVQSQSYIEYPNDPNGNTVFWERLLDVLSE